MVEKHNGERGAIEKTLSGKCISDVENLKRGQGRRGVAESP